MFGLVAHCYSSWLRQVLVLPVSSITDVIIAGAAACGGSRAASAGSAASVTAATVAAEEAAAMAQFATSSVGKTFRAKASRVMEAAQRATAAATAAKNSNIAADSDADAAAASATRAGMTRIEKSNDALLGTDSVLCASATVIITAAVPASAAHSGVHPATNTWGFCGGGGGLPVWLPSPNFNSLEEETGRESLILLEIRMMFATATKAAEAAALLGAMCPCLGGCGTVVHGRCGSSGGGAVAANRAAAARATVVRTRLRRRFRPQCHAKEVQHPVIQPSPSGFEHNMATGLNPDVELELAVEAHVSTELAWRVSNGHSEIGRPNRSYCDERATIRSIHLAVNPQPDTNAKFDDNKRSPYSLLTHIYCPFCMVPLYQPNLLDSARVSLSMPPSDVVTMCATSFAVQEAAVHGKRRYHDYHVF
eukprot:g1554.t1